MKLHPLTVAAACASIAVLAAVPWPDRMPGAMLVLGPIAAAAALSALAAPGGARRWSTTFAAAGLPFVASLLLVHGLFTPGGVGVVVAVGPFALTTQGLAVGWSYAAPLLVVLSALACLTAATDAEELVDALEDAGAPADVSLLLRLSFQFVPVMRGRVTAAAESLSSRGLDTGGPLFARIRAARIVMLPVVLSTLDELDARARMLDARGARIAGGKGARARQTRMRKPPDGRWQRVARRTLPPLALAAVVYLRWFAGWPRSLGGDGP